MGIFSASDLDVSKAGVEFQHVLMAGETIMAAFRHIRDSVLLTDRRLVYVNVQGLTGSKVEHLSVPWRSVVRFSVESAGTFDLDTDMKIWVSGQPQPIEVKISRSSDPRRIQMIMAEQVVGRTS